MAPRKKAASKRWHPIKKRRIAKPDVRHGLEFFSSQDIEPVVRVEVQSPAQDIQSVVEVELEPPAPPEIFQDFVVSQTESILEPDVVDITSLNKKLDNCMQNLDCMATKLTENYQERIAANGLKRSAKCQALLDRLSTFAFDKSLDEIAQPSATIPENSTDKGSSTDDNLNKGPQVHYLDDESQLENFSYDIRMKLAMLQSQNEKYMKKIQEMATVIDSVEVLKDENKAMSERLVLAEQYKQKLHEKDSSLKELLVAAEKLAVNTGKQRADIKKLQDNFDYMAADRDFADFKFRCATRNVEVLERTLKGTRDYIERQDQLRKHPLDKLAEKIRKLAENRGKKPQRRGSF